MQRQQTRALRPLDGGADFARREFSPTNLRVWTVTSPKGVQEKNPAAITVLRMRIFSRAFSTAVGRESAAAAIQSDSL
jgi:hypothetical protein